MGKSTLRQGLESAVHNFARDAETMANIGAMQAAMNSGEYPRRFIDCVFQGTNWKSGRRVFDMYEAFVFERFLNLLFSGSLCFTAIPVGAYPKDDSDKDGMNAILDKLPAPFKAEFVGLHAGEDGWVTWDKPIHAWKMNGDGMVIVPPVMHPNGMPLEVGTTEPEKSLFYLKAAAPGGFGRIDGLARWPYGSDWLFLIHPAKRCLGTDDPGFTDMKNDAVDTLLLSYDPKMILELGGF